MKISIIYDSATGNTKKLADEISRMFEEKTNIEYSDIVFIGSWTDKGSPTLRIQEELKKLKNKKIFYFGTCGFGGSEEYFNLLFERVKEYIDESNEILGYYYCQGRMPEMVKKRYETMLEENPNDEKVKQSIENYEEALKHPNTKDLENLRNKIKSIL